MQQVSSEFDPGAGSAIGHRECHVGEGPAKGRRIAEPRPDSHGEWRRTGPDILEHLGV